MLVAWENEAFQAKKEFGEDKFEVVIPSLSILAEPPVSIVDKVVDEHKTREVAEAYLKYLYSDEGQDIIGRNFYRPREAKAAEKYAKQFPKLELVTVTVTSVVGPRRRRPISTTAAFSIKFTNRKPSDLR